MFKDYLPNDEEASNSEEGSFAFTLRKYAPDIDQEPAEIIFENNGLWELLKSELNYFPDHTFRGDAKLIKSPYPALVWNWDRLVKLANQEVLEEDVKLAHSDLKLLLTTIETDSGDNRLDKYFKTREANLSEKVVTYDNLWTAFPPGTLVYGRPFADKHQVFISFPGRSWPAKDKWFLECWTYDWNGTEFARRLIDLAIEKFDGQKPLTSLPHYPFELHKNFKTLELEMIERGKKFRKLCLAKQTDGMYHYDGEAVLGGKGISKKRRGDDYDDASSETSDSDDLDRVSNSTKVSGTVMVDFQSSFKYDTQAPPMGLVQTWENNDRYLCDCDECRNNPELSVKYRLFLDGKKGNEDWPDEQFLLCPPRVLGYILLQKQWAQLYIGGLKKVDSEDYKDTWNNKLHLADNDGTTHTTHTKDLLLNLVRSHGHPAVRDKIQDIVEDKGRGLVILLYGPPGVGKTTTAETVAGAVRKPLFPVGVTDVGTKASSVETNLGTIFDLATKWDAILLIDEADVFLERRQKGPGNNMEKNALVSVFLRVLEYYKGILILTTNQINYFDVAIQSRVHIAVEYRELNQQQTMAIFRQFLDQLKGKGFVDDMKPITDYLEEDVCKLQFDGRQIRNIMTSAVGLVHGRKGTKLGKKEIKEVVNIVKSFKDDYARQYDTYKKDTKEGRYPYS
ncbi:hypothetical protein AAFC00_004291 [Neodothiora populina]|uniref:AAA+ ATPase domain-containing protein n=1 Tax=Neodothiora populina TaxID=2781224 RepID=A0ABR3PJ87_9PEZI